MQGTQNTCQHHRYTTCIISLFLLSLFYWKDAYGFHVTKRSQFGDNVFDNMENVGYTTYTSTGSPKQLLQIPESTVKTRTTLVPIATQPLLLVSSGLPLLNSNECKLLSEYFQVMHRPQTNKQASTLGGKVVLENLQTTLNNLLLRQENTSVEPRYLFYDAPEKLKYSPNVVNQSQQYNNNNIPDGLHVDTNNGKYFRYLTVLVYLTDSHAATVFPMAQLNSNHHVTHMDTSNEIIQAAKTLIRSNICHTRQQLTSSTISDLSTLERPKKSFVHSDSDIVELKQQQMLLENSLSTAIRIVPRQGHIAAFINIDPSNGHADPYSFHGPEEAFDEKQVLTFFYEIPMDQFASQEEFGYQVGLRVDALKQKYLS